jgi:hypothetical protein
MPPICSTTSILEDLPDEILLIICRYLSSVDVLFSFYGLNFRLSQTISDYCRDVFLSPVAYQQLTYSCSLILPEIGTNICSLTVSDQWTGGILSKVFLTHFDGKMSLSFPRLQHLTLMSFSTNSLMSFLNCLQNLTELFELKIGGLHENVSESVRIRTLMHQIFSANNNRLSSIAFDYDSMSCSFDNNNDDTTHPNIEKLNIEIKTLNDLHRLLTLMSGLQSLYVTIDGEFFGFDDKSKFTPVHTLKHFRLRSFNHSWNLNELVPLLNRISNVEILSVSIGSYDDPRLLDGQQLFSHLQVLSLNEFNYFLRFYAASSIEPTKILCTWQQFQQKFVCIKSDDGNSLVLNTLPLVFPSLDLKYSLAKNIVFTERCMEQIRSLILSEVSTRIAETFSILIKCRRIKYLALRIDDNVVSSKCSCFNSKNIYFCLS